MSFKCGDCGWVVESGQRTAIEIHKLSHIIINMTKSLGETGILPKQEKVNLSKM